ncbi:bifunctional DNA primase/polymerase [Planctomycetota bacterium]
MDLGWPIIPLWSVDKDGRCLCHRKDCRGAGKHPHSRLAPNGIEDATKDREKVKLWFASNDLNIGILTGPESRLVVLDVNSDKGGNESLATLEARYGRFEAIKAVTGDGGIHLVMQFPKGKCITNWINEIGPGLVIRGPGDYIVACPSRHANGLKYEWKDDPAVVELPFCPEWLVNAETPDRAAWETMKQITKG